MTTKVVSVRWKMPDGTFEELPLAEIEAAQLRQAQAMAASEHPELQELGEAKLKALADRLAREHAASIQPKIAAKAPRSSRRSPIKPKILDVMAEARAAHTFDEFLRAWLESPYDELAISEDGNRYIVEDTHAGGEARYTRGTLLKLWSEAAK